MNVTKILRKREFQINDAFENKIEYFKAESYQWLNVHTIRRNDYQEETNWKLNDLNLRWIK